MLFKTSAQGGMMAALEKFTGNRIKDGVLILPENFGEGTIRTYELGPLMQMMLHQYVLRQDVTGQRPAGIMGKELITFSFRHVLQHPGKTAGNASSPRTNLMPCVQVSSGDVDLETFTPANTNINIIIITAHVDLLKDLLNGKEENRLLQNIVSGRQPYLYDELISAEIQAIAVKIFEADTFGQLSDFFLKVKAQELIYLFLAELLKRETVTSYPINASDVKMMYLIRDKLATDLSIVINLRELTILAHMSESKMNRLFKQIFGTTIYSYHQTLRLNEAAYLLRTEKVSVSEVGYRLGFTNLSHFSRIFERHTGMKPKKYSAVSVP
jgi:AraC-like DNA-binding protein